MLKNLRILIVILCVLFIPFGVINAMEEKFDDINKISILDGVEPEEKLCEIEQKINEIENINFDYIDKAIANIECLDLCITSLNEVEKEIKNEKNKERLKKIESRLEILGIKIIENFSSYLKKQYYMEMAFEKLDEIIRKFKSSLVILMTKLYDYCRSRNPNYKKMMEKKYEEIQSGFDSFLMKIFKERFAEIEDFKFDFSLYSDLQVLYEKNMPKIKNKELIMKDARYFFDYINPSIFVDCYNVIEIHRYKRERFLFLNFFITEEKVKQLVGKTLGRLNFIYLLLVYEKIYEIEKNNDLLKNMDTKELCEDIYRCVRLFQDFLSKDSDIEKLISSGILKGEWLSAKSDSEHLGRFLLYFVQFYERFPDLPWSEKAKVEIEEIGNKFAKGLVLLGKVLAKELCNIY